MHCYGGISERDLLFVDLLLYFVPASIINYILKPKKYYCRCSQKGEFYKASGNKSSDINILSWKKKYIVLFSSPMLHLFVSYSHLWAGLNSVVSFCWAQVVIYCLFTKCITEEFCSGLFGLRVWPWDDSNFHLDYIYKGGKTLWVSLLFLQVCWLCDSLTSSAGSWT